MKCARCVVEMGENCTGPVGFLDGENVEWCSIKCMYEWLDARDQRHLAPDMTLFGKPPPKKNLPS